MASFSENPPMDVWSSIRNLKRQMKGSKNEADLSTILQKSQNSTKFSSNSSMISQKDLNASQISNKENINNVNSNKENKNTALEPKFNNKEGNYGLNLNKENINSLNINKEGANSTLEPQFLLKKQGKELYKDSLINKEESTFEPQLLLRKQGKEDNYSLRSLNKENINSLNINKDNTNSSLEQHKFEEDDKSNYNSRKTAYNEENGGFETQMEADFMQSLQHENEVLKEENRKLQQTISNLMRENQKSFSTFQRFHQQEYEEKISFYESEVKTLKEAFQRELSSKDQEIEMLNSLVLNKPQNNKINEKTLIQNYENMINMLKNDFQNEIFRMKKEHQKTCSQLTAEKQALEKSMETKQQEINKLRYFELFASILPQENRESVPGKSSRKNQNERNIESLLSKISKCMNENMLTESDFNLTSRQNTNVKAQDPIGLATDTMSKLIVAEEFPGTEDSEEGREIKGEERDTEGNLSVEEEDAFWMNYSIRDLNEKIRKGAKK